MANGYKRISITYQTDGGFGGKQPGIIVSDTQFTIVGNPGRAVDQTANYTTDGIKSLAIWGVQLETGSFPTSYIPTKGSTVTRNADEASITGTNFSSWYNQSEGTIFSESQIEFALSIPNKFPNIYRSGTFPNRLWVLYLLNVINYLQIGADAFANFVGIFSSSPQTFKVAQALSNSDLTYSASKDGATPKTGSLSKSITNTTSIAIGNNDGAVKRIARLTYWPTRLPDLELQQLTK